MAEVNEELNADKLSNNEAGESHRKLPGFRDWIKADGSTPFLPELDRYHLYVSLACPWAHRTLIVRRLKGLEEVLPYSTVDWSIAANGWVFKDQIFKQDQEDIHELRPLREIYLHSDAEYEGKFSVPLLWDTKMKRIVNNESSEIIRMLNSEFNKFCATDEQRKLDLYPADLRNEIDGINEWVCDGFNNGVYKCGHAQNQEAYDIAVREVFKVMDRLEEILSIRRYLCGDGLTEADVRAFVTLVRFDIVYVGLFKCNKRRVIDYKNLWAYTRDIYQTNGISETVDLEHIANRYQTSFRSINPLGIVAIGPDLDFTEPHGREKLTA